MKQVEVAGQPGLAAIINELDGEDVLLTRNGHAVALVSGFDDEDLEWYTREREPEFLASIARAREQAKKGQTIRHKDLKKKLGLK